MNGRTYRSDSIAKLLDELGADAEVKVTMITRSDGTYTVVSVEKTDPPVTATIIKTSPTEVKTEEGDDVYMLDNCPNGPNDARFPGERVLITIDTDNQAKFHSSLEPHGGWKRATVTEWKRMTFGKLFAGKIKTEDEKSIPVLSLIHI